MRTALLFLPLALLACGPSGADDSGSVQDNPSEVTTDDGTYTLHLTPSADPFPAGSDISLGLHVMAGDAAVEGATVTVTPFMPDMGHGIPDDPVVTEDGAGLYTASFTFSMAGYWEVELMVDGDAGMDHATVSYEVE